MLAASTWLLVFVHVPRLPASGHGLGAILWEYRLRIIVCFAPLVSGILISSHAEKRLKQGAMNDVWSEAELAPVRGLLASPIWNWMIWIMSTTYVIGWIFIFRSGHFVGMGFLYLLVMPGQMVMRLKRIVALPVEKGGGLRDWRSFQPIQSEHWGERSTAGML